MEASVSVTSSAVEARVGGKLVESDTQREQLQSVTHTAHTVDKTLKNSNKIKQNQLENVSLE